LQTQSRWCLHNYGGGPGFATPARTFYPNQQLAKAQNIADWITYRIHHSNPNPREYSIMPTSRVSTDLNSGTYFITLTIQRWYYLFDRHNRWATLADSLRYCIDRKGLEINGYVFMLNHLHLIVTSPDMAGFLREFKKFTSKKFSNYSVPTLKIHKVG
jgi:hypothetical protein